MKTFFHFISVSLALIPALFAHSFEVLVFTGTQSGVQDAQTSGIVAKLQDYGLAHDFGVTHSTNGADFTAVNLASYDVVVFIKTEGDVLNTTQENVFRTWFENGGGFLGMDGAAATELSWTWYHEMLGATQTTESDTVLAQVEVLDRFHPIAIESAEVWNRTDVWPNFTASPRGNVHVVANLEEASYEGGTLGDDHPIVWCQKFNGGCSAYIGMGDQASYFNDSLLQTMVTNALEWAADVTPGDDTATIPDRYQTELIRGDFFEPMAIDFDNDGFVYVAERAGRITRTNIATKQRTELINLSVHTQGEFGLLGIVLDLDFATNGYLYVSYAPPAQGANQRLSRFTVSGDSIDLASEKVLLDYPVIRIDSPGVGSNPAAHHQGGCLRFDNTGNLLLSVGDNTDASQRAPRNTGQDIRDARKSAPNTNDLRGGIIRITPVDGNGPVEHPYYTIPSGNLFPNPTTNGEGVELQRREIYVMGARNPFRFCVDPHTNWLYYGDVGPDAQNFSGQPEQGPEGHDEFNQVRAASNFGWPYYIGFNRPYLDTAGNEWTNTTLTQDLNSYLSLKGLIADPNLPPPEPAWITYTYNEHLGFTEFRTIAEGTRESRAAMAGAVYQWKPGANFPQYHDRTVFLMDYSRNIFVEVKTDSNGDYLEATRFLPSLSLSQPIEMKFGPDGAMYYLEYGRGDLTRIAYAADNLPPSPRLSTDKTDGTLPLAVQFSSNGSIDAEDAQNITYLWNFGDGSPEVSTQNPAHTYTAAGTYTASLTIADTQGLTATITQVISAGNTAPVVTFDFPPNRSFFDWGDTIDYAVSANDVEDGSTAGGQITSADVVFEGALGHVAHQHNELQFNDLDRVVSVERDAGHGFDDDLFYVFDAFYEDEGVSSGGVPVVNTVTGRTRIEILPKVFMAQFFDENSGVVEAATLDAAGGSSDVISIDHLDWVAYENISLHQINELRIRVSSENGGIVRVRSGSPTGAILSTLAVPATGSFSNYVDVTAPVVESTTSQDLYFVFENVAQPNAIMRLNWIVFRGSGITTEPERPFVKNVSTASTDAIALEFDQPVDRATAMDVMNYSISGVTIERLSFSSDQTMVTLHTDGLLQSNYYTVNMNGVEDLAGDEMEINSAVTMLYQQPSFFLGFNAGGPQYIAPDGRVYIADDSTYSVSGTSGPVTLLVDFGGVPMASSSNFAAADSAVSLTAPINVISGEPNQVSPLNAENIFGVTFTHSGGDGIFNTNKGSFSNTPILGGYIYESTNEGVSGDGSGVLSGFDEIETGQQVTLTLWGVGDTGNADTRFNVTYNGGLVSPVNQTTDYSAGSAANTAPTRVQYTFTKIAGQDSLSISWGRSNADTTGFNGFSLTAGVGTVPDVVRSYVSSGTSEFSTGDTILDALGNPIVDETLFKTERFQAGDFSYSIPVDNGTYEVTLRFAEIFHTTNGSRHFNARVETNANIFSPSLDVHAEVGHDRVFEQTVLRTVTDGVLNIELIQGANDNPKINTIEIIGTEGTDVLPDPSFAKFLNDHPEDRFDVDSDRDNDGKSILFEYAFGLDAAQADGGNVTRLLPDSAGNFIFSYTRKKGLTDVEYVLEGSDDLSDWRTLGTAAGSATDAADGQEVVDFTNLISAAQAAGLTDPTRCFYRVRVDLGQVSE